MTLLSILLVLVLEWYFRLSPSYRSFRWFLRFREFIHQQFPAQFDHIGGLFLIAGLPAIVIALINGLGESVAMQAVHIVVGALILWYCLGPKDLRTVLAGYFSALEREDPQSAWEHLRELMDIEALDDAPQMARSVTHYILTEINTRFIAVIFWFALLGPAAALFYRLCTLYADMLRLEPGHPHGALLRKVRLVLDWLPARLTALAYAFVGDFVRGYSALHPFWRQANAHTDRILAETGLAALNNSAELPVDALDENIQAIALAERALLFVLVLIAVLSIFGLLI